VSRSRRLSPLDRRILGLAVPAFGALAVEPLYVLVDTAIVGRIGTKQLDGVAVAAAVLSLVAAGSNFLTYGTTERIARHLGAGDIAGAADVAVQATWLALLAGAPTAVVVALVARPVCLLFGVRGEVLDHAETYVRISAVGIPLMLFALAARGVHRGASDYRTPLWILLASNVANLLVELVLVFGVDLGVAGSAWSTVLAQVAAAIAFAPHVRRRVAAATTYRPHRAGVAPLLHAGRHLVLRVVGILGVLTGATNVAARIDAPTLAAHQIVASAFVLLALVLDALAIPAQTLVADARGRERADEARGLARRVGRLSWYAGVGLMVALVSVAPLVTRVFTADGAVIDRATAGLWCLAVLLVPGSIAFAYDGVLIGLADYRFIGRASGALLVVMVPVALALLARPSLGITGIRVATVLWMAARAAVTSRRAAALLR
jgi:putative MATE family efflux protein